MIKEHPGPSNSTLSAPCAVHYDFRTDRDAEDIDTPDSYILKEIEEEEARCEREADAERELTNCEVADFFLEQNKENTATVGNQPQHAENTLQSVSTEQSHYEHAHKFPGSFLGTRQFVKREPLRRS